jgi:hypothetical protein
VCSPSTSAFPSSHKRRKAIQNRRNHFDKALDKWKEHRLLTFLVKGYASGDLSIPLQMTGYIGREAFEGPPEDLRLAFQRNKEGSLPKSIKRVFFKRLRAAAEPRNGRGYAIHPNHMKVSVLVDVVERGEKAKTFSYPSEIILSFVVWLKECDRSDVSLAEITNLGPVRGRLECPFLRTFLVFRPPAVYGELSPKLDPFRDVPPIPPQVHRVDHVVESAAKIENQISHDKRMPGPVECSGFNVEAILQTARLSLESHGIVVSPREPGFGAGKFSRETFRVVSCPYPFRPRAVESPAHGVTSS